MVDMLVGDPFVDIGEIGFGTIEFKLMVHFVYVCMDVVNFCLMCTSWDSL